jgi:hypothetical protein
MYGFEYGYNINSTELKNLEVDNVSDILCIPKS